MNHSATGQFQVLKIKGDENLLEKDFLACEEPLEIRLTFNAGKETAATSTKSISVTMRTPGSDEELAAGFLYTEGIIRSRQDVKEIRYSLENIVEVVLDESASPDLQKLDRNFYTTSSCGVCGKSSIDAVRIVSGQVSTQEDFTVSQELLCRLPSLLRKSQEVFEQTGGLHASALIDLTGNLLMTREDVGRHNALDKLIGSALMNGQLPISKHILLLSGRASFELLQKAAMAGIRLVAAVGAPSTLAVELAKESGITLIGFLKENRFNIYSGEKRIRLKTVPLPEIL